MAAGMQPVSQQARCSRQTVSGGGRQVKTRAGTWANMTACPCALSSPGCPQSGGAVIRPCKDDMSAVADDAMPNGCLRYSSLTPTQMGSPVVFYAYRAQLGAVPAGTGAECTSKGEAAFTQRMASWAVGASTCLPARWPR